MGEPASVDRERCRLAAGRHPLTGRIARALDESCGVPAGVPLVVGCSGGGDSTALTLALDAWRERTAGTLLIVHVHHHLREDADDDAAFVQSLARDLELPVRIRDVHPACDAGSLAATARRMRYTALADAAREFEATHVAVAHQAEDQLETMLMALARGAGLSGLAGLAWRRPVPGADDLHLVRPMLGATRDEAEDLCRTAGVAWREDPSNRDRTAPRVRLREDVLPVLESLWPGAARRAGAAADVVRAADASIEAQLEPVFGPPDRTAWSRATLRSLPTLLIAAGLRRAALHALDGRADRFGHRTVERAAAAVADDERRPRRFDWPGDLCLEVRADDVRLQVTP